MNLVEIGRFIKECRKAKNLTQIQLASKIGVSEKTISKWECGNGFPDATLMLPLCKVLGITANELLSGKLLTTDIEYKDVAENNLINLKQAHEKMSKFLLMLEWVIGVLSIIILMTFVSIASLIEMPEGLRITLIFVGLIISIFGFHFCIVIEKDAGFYECGHCHHKYIPSFKKMYLSMHIGRIRYMKCPKCNKRSWQKKTIKNPNFSKQHD